MITSTKNDQVKAVIELKKKARARNEQGLFVVEGVRMAAELPKDQVKSIYVSETFAKNPENAAILAEYPGYELVSDSVFAVMSDTQTPQGVLALVRQFSYGMDELLKSDRPAHLMVLENLQDPGNLGTILRAGEGAGITGLIMSRDTVDIYNPKVIRSTMGSVFRVPFFYTDDLEQTVLDLKAGFDKKRLFYTQGDYGLLQCPTPCCNETFDNEDRIKQMYKSQSNMKIPTELIPLCPHCKKPLTTNLRCDNSFVQDEGWHNAAERYDNFLRTRKGQNIVFLELGVGYNTPAIIKYPFWRMVSGNKNSIYVCINKGESVCPEEIEKQSICLDEDIYKVIKDVRK